MELHKMKFSFNKRFSFKKPKITADQFWVGFWCLIYGSLAAAQSTGAMPWDGPLCGFATALRGPAALAISTIAFFAAGASFLCGRIFSYPFLLLQKRISQKLVF
jgi:type IV secretory pathway VirB2 component (pilin)